MLGAGLFAFQLGRSLRSIEGDWRAVFCGLDEGHSLVEPSKALLGGEAVEFGVAVEILGFRVLEGFVLLVAEGL
jgi:hypothetical protein